MFYVNNTYLFKYICITGIRKLEFHQIGVRKNGTNMVRCMYDICAKMFISELIIYDKLIFMDEKIV